MKNAIKINGLPLKVVPARGTRIPDLRITKEKVVWLERRMEEAFQYGHWYHGANGDYE